MQIINFFKKHILIYKLKAASRGDVLITTLDIDTASRAFVESGRFVSACETKFGIEIHILA